MLLGAVEASLEAHGLSRIGGGRALVACSGGADSTALAHATVTLLGARRVILGHVDHGTRAGSAEDAEVVRALAASLGASFVLDRLPPGPASEARLRSLRYRALEAQRASAGAELILVAHNQDDQAETVLFGFVRATRLLGLRGMPVRRGAILRPLLGVPRADVTAYLARHELVALEDPTNREARYLRSRLRKELLPLIEARYRPGLRGRLARLAAELGAASGLGSSSPAQIQAPAGRSPPLWMDTWGAGGYGLAIERLRTPLPPLEGPWIAAFDAASLGAPQVRLARNGDRIQPFGMTGRRKLKDLYREAGVPPTLRAALPVIEADGEIVWVPGVARSAVAPISETTLDAWVFSIRPTPELPVSQSQVTLKIGTEEP